MVGASKNGTKDKKRKPLLDNRSVLQVVEERRLTYGSADTMEDKHLT